MGKAGRRVMSVKEVILRRWVRLVVMGNGVKEVRIVTWVRLVDW